MECFKWEKMCTTLPTPSRPASIRRQNEPVRGGWKYWAEGKTSRYEEGGSIGLFCYVLFTGVHSNQDLIRCVKVWVYMGF